MRRIVTDTFLTITGPGTSIKVCRALQDTAGNVAVWWKPKTPPQRLFTVGKGGLQMRGNLVDADGTTYAYRRRGVSCTWAICKGKFTTRQVAAWWPDGTAEGAPSAQLLAAADAANEEPEPDPVRDRAVAAARASRSRTRPVSASERREARARARAARAARDAVAARRSAAAEAEQQGIAEPVAGADPAETVTEPAEIVTPAPETVTPAPEPEPAPEASAEPEPEPDQTTYVGSLGLTPRTFNALMVAGIATVETLTAMSDADVLAVPGIGPKAVDEIVNHLAEIDATLRVEG